MFENDYIIILFFDCIIIISSMEKRLFFLKKEGWFEAEITENLKNASPDELAQWVYAMADRYKFRNYLITENPGPVIGDRYSVIGIQ
jgi:hypothetical protein